MNQNFSRYHPFKPGPVLAFALALTLLLGLFLWLQTKYLLHDSWSYDQGYYLLVAQLIQHGYEPYREIYMSEPPLMVWTIGLSLGLLGSIKGMQIIIVLYSLLAITAVVSIGASLNNKWTGLLAGGLLAFNYSFFLGGHSVGPEIPSMSLALVALAAALRYNNSGRLRWIGLSAVAMAGSVLIKFFMPWLVPLIVVLITLPPLTVSLSFRWHKLFSDWRRVLKNWILWAGIFWVVVLVSWFAFDVVNLIDQTILFHLLKSEGTESSPRSENINLIIKALWLTPVIAVAALTGLVRAATNLTPRGWIPLAWLGLAFLFLLGYSPLRTKHTIVLAPILAVLAAYGLMVLIRLWRTQKLGVRLGVAAAIIVLVLLSIPELARSFATLDASTKPMLDQKMQPLADLLNQFTSPTDCLITDNPYLPVTANRMAPPWFSGLSYARFQSGSLTAQQMIDITNSQNCQVMAPILDRIKNANRPYYDWAKNNYVRVWVLDGKEIMLAKPLEQVQPLIPLNANFSNQVQLVGADWYPIEQGGYLTLYWRTQQKFTDGYKIFVQLRDESGQTVANADHEAYAGLIPTQIWPVGRIFKDTNKLIVPANLPPGAYNLYVGLYHPATGERLPILADSSGENAVIIPRIVVR